MSTPAEPGATWASRPLGELLDVLGSRSAPVGGGSAAALAAAMAAALLERCATEAGADGTRVRSANLRRELVQLVDTDAAAVVALMQGSANGADQETTALLAEAASAPMRRLCERAHELGASADRLERDGPSGLRGEARCARLLARAAGEAASAIIEINGGPGDAEPAVAGEAAAEVVDLAPSEPGSGPRWGMQSEELNATLLTWPAGHEIAPHVNDERDVLMIVLAGSTRVRVDGADHELTADQLLLIPRGCVRAVAAGPEAVRYLSVHRRRGPLLPTARTRP